MAVTGTGDLTVGGITSTLLRFTLPMMLGSLMQQCYNIADTLIVGRCIGPEALAAVGSAYALMVFLTSVLLGLAMGSGTVFSLQFGASRSKAQHLRLAGVDRLCDRSPDSRGISPDRSDSAPAAGAFGDLQHAADIPVDNLRRHTAYLFV